MYINQFFCNSVTRNTLPFAQLSKFKCIYDFLFEKKILCTFVATCLQMQRSFQNVYKGPLLRTNL